MGQPDLKYLPTPPYQTAAPSRRSDNAGEISLESTPSEANVAETMGFVPRTRERQAAEINIREAAKHLEATLAGENMTSRIPDQITMPNFDTAGIDDIDRAADALVTSIESWQDKTIESQSKRTQLEDLAAKWFRTSLFFSRAILHSVKVYL